MTLINLPPTPLRAIDIPATESHNATHQWFFTEANMHECLCSMMVFADKNGTIRDTDGIVVGLWYFAGFSCKYLSKVPMDRPRKEYPAGHFLAQQPGLSYEELHDGIGHRHQTLAEQEREDRNEDPVNVIDRHKAGCLTGEELAAYDAQWEATPPSVRKAALDAFMGADDPVDMGDLGAGTRAEQMTVSDVFFGMEDEARDFDDGPFNGMAAGEHLTEAEKMAQAGASDEEIAAINYQIELETKLDDARTCIAGLLGRIDNLVGARHLHGYGATPSWYVEAAAISCGVDLSIMAQADKEDSS